MLLPVIHQLLNIYYRKRIREIEQHHQHPQHIQEKQLFSLLQKASETEYGQKYGFSEIKTYEDYKRKVPLVTYADIHPYVERMKKGETGILWPGKVTYFAQSSGTTSTRSKYIPISKEKLENTHFKGGKDLLQHYFYLYPDTKLILGKSLKLGGSVKPAGNHSYIGDLSGIMIDELPFWADFRTFPDKKTALTPDWHTKINRIIEKAAEEDIRALVGIPSWFLTLITGVLNKTGKKKLIDVWPNLEVFFHGGISFEPYRKQFDELIGHPGMRYMEIYNASEGFFAFQDEKTPGPLRLMLDYDIFYEFIPMIDYRETVSESVVPLWEVDPGVNYAVVISSSSGLWRYILGDTVSFTSIKPYKIKITGRTKHFINMVGEEVVVENTDKALKLASEKHGVFVKDYTVAPVFMRGTQKGAHEWMVEFENPPEDIDAFARDLDGFLQQINSDYQIKRTNDISLKRLILHVARPGLFQDWLAKHDKLGGQHKIPRLRTDRKLMEELLEMNSSYSL